MIIKNLLRSNITYTAFAGTVAGGLFPVAIITPPKNTCNDDVVLIVFLIFVNVTHGNLREPIRVRRADLSNVSNIYARLAKRMLYMEILHQSSIWFVEMPWETEREFSFFFPMRCVCVCVFNSSVLWSQRFEMRNQKRTLDTSWWSTEEGIRRHSSFPHSHTHPPFFLWLRISMHIYASCIFINFFWFL